MIKGMIREAVWGFLIPIIFMGCSFDSDNIDCGSKVDEGAKTYIVMSFNAPGNNADYQGGKHYTDNQNHKHYANGQDNGYNADGQGYAVNSVTRGNSNREEEYGAQSGLERGTEDENLVSSAAIFLYKAEKGVNGDERTPVTLVELDGIENQGNDVWWEYDNNITTAVFSIPVAKFPDGEYHVIVETNPKDLAWANKEYLTLGEVRDHIETKAWDEELQSDGTISYTSFLMTSANDNQTLALNRNETAQNPAKITVDVERMAAQVDYHANGTYTITAENGGDEEYEGAKVKILGAAIVNKLVSGSYLLKRVTDEVDGKDVVPKGDVIYLGKETVKENGVATNYVIDPWTEKKDGTDYTYIENLEYGEYYPGMAWTEEQKDPTYWDTITTTGRTVMDDNGEEWNSIGYTMENTTFAGNTNKKYATGVVFKAQFTPSQVESGYYGKTTLSEGETFFKWGNQLYATAEDIMAEIYTQQFTTDKFGNAIDACKTWIDIKTFAESLTDYDPFGYKKYLLEKSGDNTGNLTDGEKSSLMWDNYMKEKFGYSTDAAVEVEITDEGVKAMNETTEGAVQAFKHGQCYYTWWICHIKDEDEDSNGVMEYAIVRNNIYCLKVKSVSTLGGYIPTEGLQCEVYVRPWRMLNSETVDI